MARRKNEAFILKHTKQILKFDLFSACHFPCDNEMEKNEVTLSLIPTFLFKCTIIFMKETKEYQ